MAVQVGNFKDLSAFSPNASGNRGFRGIEKRFLYGSYGFRVSIYAERQYRAVALSTRPIPAGATSLATTAAERIRVAITSGALKLGESLSEEKLAQQLGMSRTPIREALTALQAQGLINIFPQRGSYVFKPDEQDVQALCEFRALTECRAMWLAHARDRDGTLAALKLAQERMAKAYAMGDYGASAAADAAFHDALLRGAGNPYLAQAYDIIGGQISAVRSMLLNPREIWSVSAAEHDDIIEAFSAADLTLAEAALSTHIMKMRTRYRATLTDMTDEPARRTRRRARSVA
jgi:DNA-binding GntR family transcriptional regulator